MTTSKLAIDANTTLHRAARLVGAALALAVFGAAMWFAWLGWDHEYYQVDGVSQGPYRAWQVFGCGLSIAVAAVLAYLWVRSVWAIFVLAASAVVGFSWPWALDAGATDDTGLWVVGLVFLVGGGGVALIALLAVAAALAPPRPRRPVKVRGAS